MKDSALLTPDLLPTLSAGKHRNPRQGACFMEFASYLAGERWSDHPECTHPLLAALARDVNDLTSDSARSRLLPLVTRVIGLGGDDPRLAPAIAMTAAAAALPIASMERQRALAAGMLSLLAVAGNPGLQLLADEAFAQAPDTQRWARGFLASVALPNRFGPHASMAMVHSAVTGIAFACIDDPDARLAALLEQAISVAEGILHPAPAAAAAVLQPA